MSNDKRESTITIKVGLNEEKHPQSIKWTSDDNPHGSGEQEAKAMLVSLFDKDYKDTYKIDLWTTEMQIAEMDRFMFQSLRAMAETYFITMAPHNVCSPVGEASRCISMLR